MGAVESLNGESDDKVLAAVTAPAAEAAKAALLDRTPEASPAPLTPKLVFEEAPIADGERLRASAQSPGPHRQNGRRWHTPSMPHWIAEGRTQWFASLGRIHRPESLRTPTLRRRRTAPQEQAEGGPQGPRIISYMCVVAVQDSWISPRARAAGGLASEPFVQIRCPAEDDPARPLPGVAPLCFPAGLTQQLQSPSGTTGRTQARSAATAAAAAVAAAAAPVFTSCLATDNRGQRSYVAVLAFTSPSGSPAALCAVSPWPFFSLFRDVLESLHAAWLAGGASNRGLDAETRRERIEEAMNAAIHALPLPPHGALLRATVPGPPLSAAFAAFAALRRGGSSSGGGVVKAAAGGGGGGSGTAAPPPPAAAAAAAAGAGGAADGRSRGRGLLSRARGEVMSIGTTVASAAAAVASSVSPQRAPSSSAGHGSTNTSSGARSSSGSSSSSSTTTRPSFGQTPVTFYRHSAPGLPFVDDDCFRQLFLRLSPEDVLAAFAALASEQRVLVHSSDASALTPCCEALLALLHPLRWQHVYCPVLSAELIFPQRPADFFELPVPFLMGVHRSLLPPSSALPPDIVVVDLDGSGAVGGASGASSGAAEGFGSAGKSSIFDAAAAPNASFSASASSVRTPRVPAVSFAAAPFPGGAAPRRPRSQSMSFLSSPVPTPRAAAADTSLLEQWQVGRRQLNIFLFGASPPPQQPSPRRPTGYAPPPLPPAAVERLRSRLRSALQKRPAPLRKRGTAGTGSSSGGCGAGDRRSLPTALGAGLATRLLARGGGEETAHDGLHWEDLVRAAFLEAFAVLLRDYRMYVQPRLRVEAVTPPRARGSGGSVPAPAAVPKAAAGVAPTGPPPEAWEGSFNAAGFLDSVEDVKALPFLSALISTASFAAFVQDVCASLHPSSAGTTGSSSGGGSSSTTASSSSAVRLRAEASAAAAAATTASAAGGAPECAESAIASVEFFDWCTQTPDAGAIVTAVSSCRSNTPFGLSSALSGSGSGGGALRGSSGTRGGLHIRATSAQADAGGGGSSAALAAAAAAAAARSVTPGAHSTSVALFSPQATLPLRRTHSWPLASSLGSADDEWWGSESWPSAAGNVFIGGRLADLRTHPALGWNYEATAAAAAAALRGSAISGAERRTRSSAELDDSVVSPPPSLRLHNLDTGETSNLLVGASGSTGLATAGGETE